MTKTEQINQHCKQLKLTALASHLETAIAEAEKGSTSYLELINRLMEKEVAHRRKKDWLNMAEIEFHVLNGQCLNRHIATEKEIKSEVDAWQNHRNNKASKINWQFTNDQARIKLKRLDPSISNQHNTRINFFIEVRLCVCPA